ncbi:hypothetical protein SDC9_03657 [bioreactor metagenome]|uniref:DUF4015 domain-containing protein n=1 Tax=bioreactor metagenome TaxID=1076179 RepID=A0A644SU16_9ZZZZ|nr:putative glycoside hydrolase [Methanobrevibacter sp.]MEA4956268.1 putative glycoside hydrolase [Methanobrevibacter sp.]
MRKIDTKSIKKRHIALIAIIFIIALLLNGFATVALKDSVQNAVWVQGKHMNDVDLDNLSKNGVQNIFLHSSAVDEFGEKNVSNWAKKANEKGIKVHIWVQCFYNGTWVNPIDTDKKDFNYDYFNKKIDQIDKFAAIPGISGIQLDYIRYPGNAYEYNYPNGVTSTNAVSKFVSMVSDSLKDKDVTLSATVMPEKEDEKYYGQDVRTLSQYVDVIIPMAYSGNYNQDSSWIKETASYFKSLAWWSKVTMGIQVYDSDENETSLPINTIKENSKAALDGGADGIALFNWELMKKWFNLNHIK